MILYFIFSLAEYSFPVFLAYLNTKGVGRIRDSYAQQRHSRGGFAQLLRILPASRVSDEAVQTMMKYSTALIVKYFSKMGPDLKRHNRVTYSSKLTY